MNGNLLEISVGDIVAEKLSRSRVFEQYGLDYCCNGNVVLKDACKEKGIDPVEVIKALSVLDEEKTDGESTDWRNAALTELSDHIVETHHEYLNKELPRLNGLMGKVVAAHSANHPELSRAEETLKALTAELTQHMAKEEQVLFPIIRQMDSTGKSEFHCGSVSNPIRVMEAEHDNAGNALTPSGMDFVSDFSIVNPILVGTYTGFGRPLIVASELIHNTDGRGGRDTGWALGVAYGEAKKEGDSRWYYQYQALQQDAVLSPFAQDDFLLSTGFRGSVGGWMYQLRDSVQVHLWGSAAKRMVSTMSTASERNDQWRAGLDFNIKF